MFDHLYFLNISNKSVENFHATAEYLENVVAQAIREDLTSPQEPAGFVHEISKQLKPPLSHADLILLARRGKDFALKKCHRNRKSEINVAATISTPAIVMNVHNRSPPDAPWKPPPFVAPPMAPNAESRPPNIR